MLEIIICVIAGLLAGVGTGLAGLSAAAVISPLLIITLKIDPYLAVAISLLSDVLASLVSSYTYYKNGNIDLRRSVIMLGAVLCFTLVGSYIASIVPSKAMGNFSLYMTILLGIKFIIKPSMEVKEKNFLKSKRRIVIETIAYGSLIGFICGFVGAGGGLMMLIVLTSIIGYDLKKAVGNSVFIMSFTALLGGLSHVVIGGMPPIIPLITCVISTTVFARLAALFANKVDSKTSNRVTGIMLVVLGVFLVILNIFNK